MKSSELVEHIVRASGSSKSALCADSGISRSLLDDYLKGRRDPSLRQLHRLADAAGCVLEHQVRRRPLKRVPDQFIAVLEFGDLFPRNAPKPLVDLRDVWQRTAS